MARTVSELASCARIARTAVGEGYSVSHAIRLVLDRSEYRECGIVARLLGEENERWDLLIPLNLREEFGVVSELPYSELLGMVICSQICPPLQWWVEQTPTEEEVEYLRDACAKTRKPKALGVFLRNTPKKYHPQWVVALGE